MTWSTFDFDATPAPSVRPGRRPSRLQGRPDRSRPSSRFDGLVRLPAWLLAASPSAPSDVFILGPRGPILYAARGTPTGPLLERTATGLALWGTELPPDRYVSVLVGAIARSASRRLESPADSSGTIRQALRALLHLAGAQEVEPDPLAVGNPAEVRQAATAGIVAAAAILAPLLGTGELASAVVAGGSGRLADDPVVERSIDGAILGALLGPRVAGIPDPEGGWPFLAGMLLRDLTLLGRASSPAERLERHPLAAVTLLHSCLASHRAVLDSVARHHERPDGSGYPKGLTAAELSELDVVVAAADALAGSLPPGGLAGLRPAEISGFVHFVVGRRFPDSIAAALVEVVSELSPALGTLSARSRAGLTELPAGRNFRSVESEPTAAQRPT